MKIRYLLIFILFILFISGCGKKVEPIMDQPAEDGNYHYRNLDLNFNLTLPPEFIYYQTQREQTDDFVDIEFFVPVADKMYQEEVPGYANPITVRVFQKEYWDSLSSDSAEQLIYIELDKKDKKVYTIQFWENIPPEWREKWTEEMKDWIIDNFSLR
ncbi:MAG: hypothetical protein ABIG60_05430 [Patescibacteria group bacterium]